MSVADAVRRIQARADHAAERARRNPRELLLIGATKQVEPARIREAFDAGLHHFGENYVQEGLAKMAAVGASATWHFLGHLQTNKVKSVIGRFAFVHSIDRLPLLAALQKHASAAGVVLEGLVEVNLAGEATKSGATITEAGALLARHAEFPNLRLIGLMTIPPPGDAESARPYYRRLRELRDEWQDRFGLALPQLSMGMSGDFEVAIKEGATMVRVGTGIFGVRPPRIRGGG